MAEVKESARGAGFVAVLMGDTRGIFENQAYYHPLFLYESLWDVANMVLLLRLARRFPDRLKKGELFLIYVGVYAVGRFWLDFLRLDASKVLGINFNQTVMGILMVLVLFVLGWRHRRQPAIGLGNGA